jgi:hypothetical protein
VLLHHVEDRHPAMPVRPVDGSVQQRGADASTPLLGVDEEHGDAGEVGQGGTGLPSPDPTEVVVADRLDRDVPDRPPAVQGYPGLLLTGAAMNRSAG